MDLSKYKGAPLTLDVNYLLIPVTIIDQTEEGAREWNDIYKYHLNLKHSNKITRTRSGGISTDRRVYRPPMWDVRMTKTCLELTSLLPDGVRRIQFRTDLKKEAKREQKPDTSMLGRQALTLFTKKLKEISGIYLDEYAIDDGLEYREAHKPEYIIKVNPKFIKETVCIEDALTYYPVHHIDFHSSFPAGLANAYPEFRKTIAELYRGRNEHPEYKGCLNSSIGAMWSPYCNGACYAPLAIAAIEDNNRRLMDITKRLEESGRIPLVWNVDGVWYLGDVYHGEGEGDDLGEWHNDHVDCKFRAKTRGAYEFEENGVYTPVVRGVPSEEKSTWQWGDIFNRRSSKAYEFIEGEGVRIFETAEI